MTQTQLQIISSEAYDAFYAEKDYEKAVPLLTQMITLSPPSSPTLQIARQIAVMFANGGSIISRDSPKAVDLLTTLSSTHNDAFAHFALGLLHLAGRGVEKDYSQAASHFTRAADQDHPGAMYYLGVLHELGLGFDKDHEKAMSLFKKSADLDNADSCTALAVIHQTSGDSTKATKYYTRAARENLLALVTLSSIQEASESQPRFQSPPFLDLTWLGTGVNPSKCLDQSISIDESTQIEFGTDTVLDFSSTTEPPRESTIGLPIPNKHSFHFSNMVKSAGEGNAMALFSMGLWYELNLVPPANHTAFMQMYCTPDQLAKNETPTAAKIALDMYNRAANKGFVPAQLKLSCVTAKGRLDVPADLSKAFTMFSKIASISNDPLAHYNLGVMYLKGWGVEKDFGKARQEFTEAADQDLSDAKFNLALMYDLGIVGSRDIVVANRLFEEAAEEGLVKPDRIV
ncbi:hypothetical protein HDU79_008085 [Rhizoclosmatium sp. JEL0117]|nr:hypothetical protein HDU79_008085 [Rhizoclosmatium sp. JEL0117]